MGKMWKENERCTLLDGKDAASIRFTTEQETSFTRSACQQRKNACRCCHPKDKDSPISWETPGNLFFMFCSLFEDFYCEYLLTDLSSALQVHFRSGIGGNGKVTEEANQLISELDRLITDIKEQTTTLEACLSQIDQYQHVSFFFPYFFYDFAPLVLFCLVFLFH